MSLFINLNGELIPRDRAVFNADNRAFHFGDALFETMRLVAGKIPFLPEHLTRLKDSMALLGLNATHLPNINQLHHEGVRLANRCRLIDGARIRLTVYRNGGGTYFPEDDHIHWCLEAWPLASEFQLNSSGIKIDVFNTFKKNIDPLSSLKGCSTQLYIQAARYCKAMSLDEVLILNTKNNICEGVSSNVFFLVNERIITPSLKEGCLPGTMRKLIIQLLQKGGVEVLETSINPSILEDTREVFFTNAIKGVQWVMGYQNKRYFHKLSEQLIATLNEETHLRLNMLNETAN